MLTIKFSNNLWSSLIALVYVAITAIVAQLVNQVVPEPYLDEIFHIPQAQRYCGGNYKGYDPKLTTPPGLYLISVFLGKIKFLFAFEDEKVGMKGCIEVDQLRQTALFASFLLPYILASYHLARPTNGSKFVQWQRSSIAISPMEALTRAEANPKQAATQARSTLSTKQAQLHAQRRKGWWGLPTRMMDDLLLTLDVHTIAMLPPMWFFGFLYYTDLPSTIFVISMLAAAKRGQNIFAAFLGCISLTLRQTNIVWILFAMGTSILQRLETVGLNNQPLSTSTVWKQIKSISNTFSLSALKIVCLTSFPYLPVFAASLAFILYNGSIVLGDKEHHQVSTHWVQPLYFVTFTGFFAWPSLLTTFALTRRGCKVKAKLVLKEIMIFSVILSLALTAIHYGTVEHPFLLADNRHYAFYFWRRIIKRSEWTRYVLAIPYSISIRLWWITLSKRYSLLWLMGFITCLSAAVIPSPLIEPRYFMIPYIIARLGLTSETRKETVSSDTGSNDTSDRGSHLIACVLELGWAGFINCVTLYLFLYKPFRWSDSDEWQRFLW